MLKTTVTCLHAYYMHILASLANLDAIGIHSFLENPDSRTTDQNEEGCMLE